MTSNRPRSPVRPGVARPPPAALRPCVALAAGAGALAASAALVPTASDAADVRTEPGEYLAIVVEAEANATGDERWVPTDPTTGPSPGTSPDPDGNHSDGAVGGAYVELLPDHRVTHADTEFEDGTPARFWDTGESAPALTWRVDFPEPGRYHVHARAFSTGTEDNGVHVGLDGRWPASGERLQWCAGKHSWHWSSAQRGDTHETACGRERTIWLDVTEAGVHEVSFGAREDGFELDRFMLIRDLSGGTRVCSPEGGDDIECVDGAIQAIDGLVDVGVTLEAGPVPGAAANRHGVTATVTNRDGRDVASVVTLDVALGRAIEPVEADVRCTVVGDALACALGDLAPNASTDVAFTLDTAGTEPVTLVATVASNENDASPADDEASVPLGPRPAAPSLNASLALDVDAVAPGATVRASLTVSNAGAGAASDVRAALSVPDGLDVAAVGPECTNARPIVCLLPTLGAGEDHGFDVELVAATEGSVQLLLDVAAADVGPMNASATLVVRAQAGGPGTGNGVDAGAVPIGAVASPSAGARGGSAGSPGGAGGGGLGWALLGALGAAAAMRTAVGRDRKPIRRDRRWGQGGCGRVWARLDSNQRPRNYEFPALTN